MAWGLLALCAASCTQNGKKQESKQATTVSAPSFQGDSAYAFVKRQVDFGPRVPGSAGHKACGDYLVERFKAYGAAVFEQKGKTKTYDGKQFEVRNIIASINPTAAKRMMLSAHWDSRHLADQDTKDRDKPILGANDGGSGVAVLLEIARVLQQQQPVVGVDLMLWDVEDYGQPENSNFPEMQDSYCLGTQYWAKNPPVKGYNPMYCINLDMVGGPNARFAQEGVSMNFAPAIVQKVWDIANQKGFSATFIYQRSNPITDDHYYVNQLAGIPAIDIIEYDEATSSNFNKHWHTHQDDMSNIDKNTLKAVGQTLLELIFSEK